MKTHSQYVPSGVFTLLAVTIAAVGMAAAQESPPDAESGGVLRVETRLVQVDVVVRDDDGPVGNLSVEDFTLHDEGEPVEIVLFEITQATAPAPQVEIAAVPGALSGGAVSNRQVPRFCCWIASTPRPSTSPMRMNRPWSFWPRSIPGIRLPSTSWARS